VSSAARFNTAGELTRFALVGVASNVLLYLLYLLLTSVGVGPKTSMTVAYLVGVLQSFALNRRWTFVNNGARLASLLRYGVVYASGYVVNYALLLVLVDRFGVAHQAAQGFAIFVVAAFLFLAQKYWVFR